MKKYLPLIIVPVILIICAFSLKEGGSIYGRINPYNAALNVWAISDNDTNRSVIRNGEFEIRNLKAGRYRVVVEGRYPYRVTTRPDVVVIDSASTNVGEIVVDK